MIAIKKGTFKYACANWKIFTHLLLRTRHFGVNNKWWYHEPGLMGLPLHKIILRIVLIYPLIKEYYCIRFRAVHNKFIPIEETNLLGWNHKNTPAFFTVLSMSSPIFFIRWLFRKRKKNGK